ncbi:hypothetical protein C1645_663839, partial [Glomus cerebriforme]
DGKIPRPPNSFFLFRPVVRDYASHKKMSYNYEGERIILTSNQNYLGKVASVLWNRLSKPHKDKFKELSEEIKKKHLLENPGYRYSPKKPK